MLLTNTAQFLTGNFDDEILGYILEIRFVHSDTASGWKCIHNAVHTIHRESAAISCASLKWKYDLRQGGSQATPLQDNWRQWVKLSKFLQHIFRCTPDRLCATRKYDNRHKRLQSINEPINQSINPSIDKPIDEAINESINQWINESMNQSINQSINQLMNQSINEPMNEWMNEWINQSINRWTNEWMNQSIHQSQPLTKITSGLQNKT